MSGLAKILGSCFIVMCGCGRLGFDDEPEAPIPSEPLGDPTIAPAVCRSTTLGTIVLAALPIDMTVTATPAGATLLWTPPGGGMRRLDVDPRAASVGDPEGLQILTDTWIQRISSSYLDGAVIAAVQDDATCVAIDVLDPALGGYYEAKHMFPQNHAGRQPILRAGLDRVTITSLQDGINVTTFDAAWRPQANVMTFSGAAGVDTIAATAFQGEGVIAWSTATACNFATVTGLAPMTGTWAQTPCPSPRLTASSSDVVMVFESPEGIRMVRAVPGALAAATSTLIAPGSSPRVIHDGARYWISYLDPNGELVVGYLGPTDELEAILLPITTRARDYELIVMGGTPWLFAASDREFSAHEICLPM